MAIVRESVAPAVPYIPTARLQIMLQEQAGEALALSGALALARPEARPKLDARLAAVESGLERLSDRWLARFVTGRQTTARRRAC